MVLTLGPTLDVSQFHGIPWYSMSHNYWKDFLTKIYDYGMEETTDGFGIPRNWETTVNIVVICRLIDVKPVQEKPSGSYDGHLTDFTNMAHPEIEDLIVN